MKQERLEQQPHQTRRIVFLLFRGQKFWFGFNPGGRSVSLTEKKGSCPLARERGMLKEWRLLVGHAFACG